MEDIPASRKLFIIVVFIWWHRLFSGDKLKVNTVASLTVHTLKYILSTRRVTIISTLKLHSTGSSIILRATVLLFCRESFSANDKMKLFLFSLALSLWLMTECKCFNGMSSSEWRRKWHSIRALAMKNYLRKLQVIFHLRWVEEHFMTFLLWVVDNIFKMCFKINDKSVECLNNFKILLI